MKLHLTMKPARSAMHVKLLSTQGEVLAEEKREVLRMSNGRPIDPEGDTFYFDDFKESAVVDRVEVNGWTQVIAGGAQPITAGWTFTLKLDQ